MSIIEIMYISKYYFYFLALKNAYISYNYQFINIKSDYYLSNISTHQLHDQCTLLRINPRLIFTQHNFPKITLTS